MQKVKDEEQRKWLMEGHGARLCLLMAAHMHALFHGMVLLEDAETQTNAVTTMNINIQMTPVSTTTTVNVDTQTAATTQINVSTQAAPQTKVTATQTTTTPKHQCVATQTEPLDDEGPTLMKNAKMALPTDFSMQTTPSTNETATQMKNKPYPAPIAPGMTPQSPLKLPHPCHPHLPPTSTTAAPRLTPPHPQPMLLCKWQQTTSHCIH